MTLLKFFMPVCRRDEGVKSKAGHSKAQHSTRSVAAAGRIASKQTVQVRKTPLWNRKDGRPKRSYVAEKGRERQKVGTTPRESEAKH